MSYEPQQSRGEWRDPVPRNMWLPPRKQRWPAPTQVCGHCGRASETSSKRCPVCDAPFRVSRVSRARRVVGRLLHRA